MDQPSPFLTIRVHDLGVQPGVSGLCVGYERGSWRYRQFVTHLSEWIPEFALSPTELQSLSHSNSVALIRRAFATVYKTEKFRNRGEFGELLLHIAMRQVFETIPAVSKLYYKSAPNDTVKGFDAVHVVAHDDELELWIGEAKFYADINQAIRDVVIEIKDHTATDYLRTEFALVQNKVDPAWPHASRLRSLLDENTSLDDVFARCCVPVLLTYDSRAVQGHTSVTEEYESQFCAEVNRHRDSFAVADLPPEIRFHLFLLPLESKSTFVESLDDMLKGWQAI